MNRLQNPMQKEVSWKSPVFYLRKVKSDIF